MLGSSQVTCAMARPTAGQVLCVLIGGLAVLQSMLGALKPMASRLCNTFFHDWIELAPQKMNSS